MNKLTTKQIEKRNEITSDFISEIMASGLNKIDATKKLEVMLSDKKNLETLNALSAALSK